jgi:hypothetical protein
LNCETCVEYHECPAWAAQVLVKVLHLAVVQAFFMGLIIFHRGSAFFADYILLHLGHKKDRIMSIKGALLQDSKTGYIVKSEDPSVQEKEGLLAEWKLFAPLLGDDMGRSLAFQVSQHVSGGPDGHLSPSLP